MPTVGRTATVMAFVGLCCGSAGVHAMTTCEQAKLKAQGKLELCLKKNSARVLGGKADVSATCQATFQKALTKADHIAIAAGTTACRYVDNGDGTVNDLNTGLQWEKKTGTVGTNIDCSTVTCSDPHDVRNTYPLCSGTYPYCANTNGVPDGAAYTDFLGKLNNGASTDGGASTPITGCFAGHCDWRLPTIVELQGLFDATQGFCNGGHSACIDPAFGPTTTSFHWSATTTAGSPTSAYDQCFFVDCGVSGDFHDKRVPSYVRAVRGGL
jgi:hypothetical protein